MKILYVSNYFKPHWEGGGPTKICYDLAILLNYKGHDITVFTTEGSNPGIVVDVNKEVLVDDIKVYYFSNVIKMFAKKFHFFTPFHSIKIIKNNIKNFDIIHIHEGNALLGPIVCYYARKFKIPYVWQGHGSLINKLDQKYAIYYKILDKIFGDIVKHASAAVALNENEALNYQKMGIDRRKIYIIPNGIDVKKYLNYIKTNKFRLKYGLLDKKIILYLGRINKIKGIEIILEALTNITISRDNYVFIIAGPDDGFLKDVIKLIEKYQIGDNVIIAGPIYEEDKINLMKESDLFVLMSHYDTYPISVLEASACGLPSIISKHCEISNLLDGKSSIIIENESKILANNIVNLLSNPLKYEDLKDGGIQLALSTFNINSVALKLEDLYKSLYKMDLL